jgi:hypothetical protein
VVCRLAAYRRVLLRCIVVLCEPIIATRRFGRSQLLGSSTLMLDYPGYGRSEGWPTEKGLYTDAETGYQYCSRPATGQSKSSCTVSQSALRLPYTGHRLRRGMLDAPFTSARDVAQIVLKSSRSGLAGSSLPRAGSTPQAQVKSAPVVVVITAVYERMGSGAKNRRWTDYEAGLASENLLLEAVALSGPWSRGASPQGPSRRP